MKEIPFLLAILVLGLPPSHCAQPPRATAVLNKKAEHMLQTSHFRASRSNAPLSRSASSRRLSSESSEEEHRQKSGVASPSVDDSREWSKTGDSGTADKSGNEVSGDDLADFDLPEGVKAAVLPGEVDASLGAHSSASTESRVADTSVSGGVESDFQMRMSDKDHAAAEDTAISSFGERMEAMMQSLVGADVFSALRHFEDVLAPMSFTGPRVTTRMDENDCVFEVNLEHLPETASLRVGVERGRVYVEYANSVQEVSVERERYSKEKQAAEDQVATQESGTPETAAFPGYSVGSADVFSFESFQVPSACDHESGLAKAARIGPGKLLVKFPLIKSRSTSEPSTQAAISESDASTASQAPSGQPRDVQESSSTGEDGASASDSSWIARLPFARRFMQEKRRENSTGHSHIKLGEEEKSPADATGGKRYIPLVQADAL